MRTKYPSSESEKVVPVEVKTAQVKIIHHLDHVLQSTLFCSVRARQRQDYHQYDRREESAFIPIHIQTADDASLPPLRLQPFRLTCSNDRAINNGQAYAGSMPAYMTRSSQGKLPM